MPEGLRAGGYLILGGAGRAFFDGRDRLAEIEIHHFAVYDGILGTQALKKRFKLLKLAA
jgi:hypothetical protein